MDQDYNNVILPIMVASPGAPYSNIFFNWEDHFFVKNFDDYLVSTITCVTILKGENKDLKALMYLTPIVGPYRRAGARPGEITSFRWLNEIRGDHGGFFKNSPIVNVMVSSKKQPISAKVSKCKIQMCGCKSIEMGIEASNNIIANINSSILFATELSDNLYCFLGASEWLLENCKGEQVISSLEINVDGKLVFEESIDYVIFWPSEAMIPDNYKYLVTQIMMRCDDVYSWNELNKRLEYFQSLRVGNIGEFTDALMIGKSMVNYNYHLGFKVDRDLLNRNLVNLGITCDYLNTKASCVTIEMFSTVENDSNVIKKIPERWSKQTFKVQLSGNVMHSGPGGEAMRDCYYKFCNVINSIRLYIEIK